jgi:anthranilate synthase component 1
MFDLNKNFIPEARIETRKIAADRLTPIKILEQLDARVLLESAYVKTGKSRYSLMLLKEAFTIYKKDGKNFLKNPDGRNYRIKGRDGNFLSLLKEFRNRAPLDENLYEFPLPTGWCWLPGVRVFLRDRGH